MFKTEERKRVNIMINKRILQQMSELVPARKMSDFVNEALERAIEDFSMRKASEGMDKLAEIFKKEGVRMSTKEFIKLKNYGR